jgi:hypothetical protein
VTVHFNVRVDRCTLRRIAVINLHLWVNTFQEAGHQNAIKERHYDPSRYWFYDRPHCLLRRENENGSGDANVGYLFYNLHRREYLQRDPVNAPHLFPMGVVLGCTYLWLVRVQVALFFQRCMFLGCT